VCGQRTSFGFVGGSNLTRDFPTTRQLFFDPERPEGLTAFDLFSDSHSFIAGFSFELDLAKGLSLEANALHRGLKQRAQYIFPSGLRQDAFQSAVSNWQWPILLKYRLPFPGSIRPFIEAGPSFRTRHNPAPAEPSHHGGTVGAGAEFGWGRFRLAPALRYTRWQYDGDFPRLATKRDQIELLAGISYATSVPSWEFGGRKLHFGVIGGTPFTGGLRRAENELQGYIAGLAIGVEWNRRLSFELNGLYRPLRVGGDPALEYTVLMWQFPVLAKYRFRPATHLRPVLEAGPSFRLSGNLNSYDPSRFGVTAGAGFETNYRALRIGPVLRYTRWARDSGRLTILRSGPYTAQNQVEFLVSLTF
jgi:hypothetical protein